MNLIIHTEQLESVSNSFGCYIFKEIRESQGNKDFAWLSNIFNVFLPIKQLSENLPSSETVEFEINESDATELSQLIEKYVISDASDYLEDNIDWLAEMMAIHAQLVNSQLSDSQGEAVEIIPEKTEVPVIDMSQENSAQTKPNRGFRKKKKEAEPQKEIEEETRLDDVSVDDDWPLSEEDEIEEEMYY